MLSRRCCEDPGLVQPAAAPRAWNRAAAAPPAKRIKEVVGTRAPHPPLPPLRAQVATTPGSALEDDWLAVAEALDPTGCRARPDSARATAVDLILSRVPDGYVIADPQVVFCIPLDYVTFVCITLRDASKRFWSLPFKRILVSKARWRYTTCCSLPQANQDGVYEVDSATGLEPPRCAPRSYRPSPPKVGVPLPGRARRITREARAGCTLRTTCDSASRRGSCRSRCSLRSRRSTSRARQAPSSRFGRFVKFLVLVCPPFVLA